jgi:hypothetical protein
MFGQPRFIGSFMSDYYLCMLLQLVNASADTASLLKQGLTYSQISRLIIRALSEGLVADDEVAGLTLTAKGSELIGLKKNLKSTRLKVNWISHDEISRIQKLSNEDIFLPNLESSFYTI